MEPIFDEPAWSLREEDRPSEQQHAENGLHDVWSAPGDLAWRSKEEAIANPSRKGDASVKADVPDRGKKTARMSRSDLALKNGDRHGQHAHGHALDRTSDDEDAETRSEDLDESRDEVYDGAYAHGHAPAKDVADICRA